MQALPKIRGGVYCAESSLEETQEIFDEEESVVVDVAEISNEEENEEENAADAAETSNEEEKETVEKNNSSDQSGTENSSSQSDTEEPSEQSSTEEPSEQPSTEEPSEQPSTEEPSEQSSTEESSEQPSTEEPSEQPSTENPNDQFSTENPSEVSDAEESGKQEHTENLSDQPDTEETSEPESIEEQDDNSGIAIFMNGNEAGSKAAASTLTVTWKDENGKTIETQKVEKGTKVKIPDTINSKDGSYFAGWESEDAWGGIFPKDAEYEVTENITFSEVWARPNNKDVTVKFVYGDNEIEHTDLRKIIKAGENPTIIMPESPRKKVGYQFWGWAGNNNDCSVGRAYIVKQNDTLYEMWDEEWYEKGMYVTFMSDTYYRGGAAVTPEVIVHYNGDELRPNIDYTAKFKNNKNAGTATLTVTGKGSFAGANKSFDFMIDRMDIGSIDDYASFMTVVMNKKVTPVLMYNGKQLKLGKDFKLSDKDGKLNDKGMYTEATTPYKVGEAGSGPRTLIAEGINNYVGTIEIAVTVVDPKAAKSLVVDIDKNFKPYYGDADLNWQNVFGPKTLTITPKVQVYDKADKAKANPLIFGTDYTIVSVSGSLYSAGAYKFMAVGMGEYSGNVSKSLKILPKPLDNVEAGVSNADTNWQFQTTNLSVSYNSAGSVLNGLRVRYTKTGATSPTYLQEGSDYKVSYSNNKKAGSAKAKITFIGDYKGTKPKEVPFTVEKALLNYTSVYVPDMVYGKAGKGYASKPIVVDEDGKIVKASEYTVSYEWATEANVKQGSLTAPFGGWKSDNKVLITLDAADTYARVRVKLTPNEKGNYALYKNSAGTVSDKYAYYYVRKSEAINGKNAIDLTKAKVEFFSDAAYTKQYKTLPYCGQEFQTGYGDAKGENVVYVKVTPKGATAPVDANKYTVYWINAKEKGKATVVIKGGGYYDVTSWTAFAVGSVTTSITIGTIGKWVEPSN